MKIFLIATLGFLFLSSTSMASVKEKKAAKAAMESVNDELADYKEKCGTSVKVDFQYDKAKAITIEGRDSVNVIKTAGSVCAEIVDRLGDQCNDADYKEEIVKIKTVKCIPTDIKSKPYWEVKLSGETLEVKHAPVNSPGSDGTDYLKDAF